MYTLPVGTKIISPTTTYTITGVLGQGGFGITYSATFMLTVGTMKVKANVALKEHFVKADCVRDSDTSRVSCSDPARSRVELTRKDFIGEARRLRKISGQHPNIVTVNEVFEANNTAYYAMEMIEGVSLRDYVASRGKLTERETLAIMTPIVEAVAFLHRNRITHLDIKPQNIMIAADDEGKLRPVLIDFGLSKHYDEDGKATSTLKTQGYSEGFSPVEQYAGITHFSPASDVYAIAATIVFCLTGSRLPTAHEVTSQKLEAILPSTLPASLRSILIRALSMHAEDRYADADALLSAIDSDTLSDDSGDDATEVGEAIVIDAAPAGPKAPVKPADVKVKPKTQSKPQKKSGRGIIIAIVVIAVLLFGGAAAYFISKSSSEVAEQPTATDTPATTEASGSTAADAELATYINSAAEQVSDVSSAEEFNAVLLEIELKIHAYRDSQPNATFTPEVKQALLNAQAVLKKKAKELNLDIDLTPLDIPTSPADTEPLQEQEETDQPHKDEDVVHPQEQVEHNAEVQIEPEAIPSQPSLDPAIQNLLANMVYVEGGTFSMGSNDSDASYWEKPIHQESVGSFRIGKYEVTQREWEAVMGSNPSGFKGDDLPVEQVSWDDCQEFIRKLNSITGKNFRLPTEAEWEYAARGGRRSNGYEFSGSDNIDNVAWYDGNSGNKTHTVGTKSPNELGLHDMSGNVLEWTSDHWSRDYNSPRSSSSFVLRGGGWYNYARSCRASSRGSGWASRYNFLGLRLAL